MLHFKLELDIAGFLRAEGILRISHETIYVHVWADKRAGGDLWTPPAAGGQEAPQTLRRLRLPRKTRR